MEVVSAVDGFDTYVAWKAVNEGRKSQEVVSHYRELIVKDLSAMDIECAAVLDVVNGACADEHAQTARGVVFRLSELGLTELVVEEVLYSPSSKRYIVGAWLLGDCPRCKSPSGGYFCDACGGHFKPQDMLNARDRLGDLELERRKVESLFLRIPEASWFEKRFDQLGISGEMRQVLQRHLQAEAQLFRLTSPGEWGGVKFDPDRLGNPRILFESGWEYALTCGSRWSKLNASDIHPLAADSSTVTIVSFGVDNAVLLLVGTIAVLEATGNKVFDRFLANYFCNLQGEKFSTSRKHAIWAEDIVKLTPAHSDAVRLFLAKNSPEEARTNFEIAEFIELVNTELVGTLQPKIQHALKAYDSNLQVPSPDDEFKKQLQSELHRQSEAFSTLGPSLPGLARQLREWWSIESSKLSGANAFWWLKGLSVMAYPVMPRTAISVWNAIGYTGKPSLTSFFEVGSTRPTDFSNPFSTLTLESLAPCLPESLLTEHQ